jgi:integrase
MGKIKIRANGDGDVFPRKNKAGKITSYRGAYVGPDGKRRYVSGKTKEEARRNLRRARGDAERGLVFDADSLKLGEYLDRWLSDSVSDTVKATTFERYEQIARLHLKPALGRLRLKALTPVHVRGLYREKLEAGLSARTVRYIHTTLHKALKQAVMDGLIPHNATESVKPPQLSREEMHPLTPEQAKLLLQVAHKIGDRLEALYVLAIHTGLRQGELLGLKWDDVDLEDGSLQVRRTLTITKSGPVFTAPKTTSSRRSVKLTSHAIEAVTHHLERQLGEIDRVGSLWSENGLIFASETGEPLNRHNLTRRSFKPLLKRVGLPEIRFHDLRHTCATLLLTRNVNPKIVSEMLGHSSIAITLDTYSHVLPNMRDQAAAAMEEALSRPTAAALLPKPPDSNPGPFCRL